MKTSFEKHRLSEPSNEVIGPVDSSSEASWSFLSRRFIIVRRNRLPGNTSSPRCVSRLYVEEASAQYDWEHFHRNQLSLIIVTIIIITINSINSMDYHKGLKVYRRLKKKEQPPSGNTSSPRCASRLYVQEASAQYHQGQCLRDQLSFIIIINSMGYHKRSLNPMHFQSFIYPSSNNHQSNSHSSQQGYPEPQFLHAFNQSSIRPSFR